MPPTGRFEGDFTGCSKPCSNGTVGTRPDHTSPDCGGLCPAGHYCEKGTVEPTPCPEGRYTPSQGATSLAACIRCDQGSFQPKKGSIACSSCPAGTYTERAGATECLECPPGGYCEEAGAATSMVWRACPAGSFNPQKGSASRDSCISCPLGTSSTALGANSNASCVVCDPDTYAARPDGECIPCPYPLASGGGSATCAFCREGFYLQGSADLADVFRDPAEHCKSCPPHAECPPNTTLETLVLPQGFWRASLSSAVLIECRSLGGGSGAGKARCAGSGSPVRAGATDGRILREDDLDYCAPDFSGPECQLCVQSDYHVANGDKCAKCPAVGTAAGKLSGLVLGICIACGLTWVAYSTKSWRDKKPCIGCLLRLADRAVSIFATLGLLAKFKITFGFYQVCLVLSTTYSARLPERYTAWADKLSEVISIDWSGFFLPPQCLPFWSRLVAVTISPISAIALLLVAGAGLRLYRLRVAPSPRPRTRLTEAALGLLDLTPASLFLVFCFVPPVSAFIFRAWACEAYTTSPPGEALEQVEYMRQDASVECGSSEHDFITLLAGLLLGLWPLGSLVLYTSLLLACHKPLQARTPTALTQATAFLHREYRLMYFWWEALDLARKLVLTGAVLLIPEERAFLRLVVATLLCSCYSVGLAAVRPYKRVEDNILAIATSLVLLLFFLAANWTTIFLGIEERHPNAKSAAAILGFDSSLVIVDAMIVLVSIALPLFVVVAIVAIRHIAKDRAIRLVSSNQKPELSLKIGLTWHLFNSHIWKTGQDATATIKRQLQILLPDINVFLDVDDLKDVGALDDYIDRSQVILFFLSLGYFASRVTTPHPTRSPLYPPHQCLPRAELPPRGPLVAREEEAAHPRARSGSDQGRRDAATAPRRVPPGATERNL